jgi:hypothetical protein
VGSAGRFASAVGGASKGRSGWPVTVVVAQVPFKQVHELSVSLPEPSVGLFELLISAPLRIGKLSHAAHDAVNDTRQVTDHIGQTRDGARQAADGAKPSTLLVKPSTLLVKPSTATVTWSTLTPSFSRFASKRALSAAN